MKEIIKRLKKHEEETAKEMQEYKGALNTAPTSAKMSVPFVVGDISGVTVDGTTSKVSPDMILGHKIRK